MSSSSENENPSPLHTKPVLRMPSPRRRPLHDRSNSRNNDWAGPSIRMVDDLDVTTYAKTPFPNHPSQILAPRREPPGYAFGDRGSGGARVSDASSATRVPSTETSNPTEDLYPKPLQLRKGQRGSGSVSNSDVESVTDASPWTPASFRLSQDVSPPSTPGVARNSLLPPGGLDIVKEESPPLPPQQEQQPLQTLQPLQDQPTIRAVHPSSAAPSQPLTSAQSKASLTSSTSTDTLVLHYGIEERSNSSSSDLAFPRPPSPVRQAKTPTYAQPRVAKRASSALPASPSRPKINQSSDSLASLDSNSSERPRSSSAPVCVPHVSFTAGTERPSVVQYPVVRAPQSSGSWAQSSQAVPRQKSKKASRMSDRFSGRPLNTQLSNNPSASGQASQSSQTRPQSNVKVLSSVPERKPVPRSRVVEQPSAESLTVPQRTLSNVRPHDWRDSDEHHDVVTELQSPPLRKQRSGYFSRFSSESRPNSSRGSGSRPSSSSSDVAHFIANTIPAWARYYYQRGERGADLAVDGDCRRDSVHSEGTSVSSEPNYRVWRPRTRPRPGDESTDSLAISEARVEQEAYVQGGRRQPMNEPWAPRLRRDKRPISRISAWRAPSFDDAFNFLSWSQGNRQVLLFCLGFFFPPLWIMASFLYVRPPECHEKDATPGQVEAAMAEHMGQIDEIRYQKARWWRNLNRIMSVVGVALIVTIVSVRA
ncbi:hypothetical protein EJ05DRAFT_502972 [Pseudovirgaria hyperparasitica]|uniref:Serine-rich protein n=1 Tax=Pseudovirgaria hyperparasitica TaxID=470096 RepID=A0A6A6W0K3_9PEZI|nr:uncharacterized protein EJ05DRAFT_502972 [Pseudovirgaria hyperparasitica]KAF2755514.1 hypothetical protein EJ05DRAFT_502972 [Pseudovirgaria hyperparasitica]